MPNVFIIGDRQSNDCLVIRTDDRAVALEAYANIHGYDEASRAPIEQMTVSEEFLKLLTDTSC